MALIHYPVINKSGEIIASAITNLDLHDIARASRTYGVRQFFVVTPLEDQKKIANRIIQHWTKGYGSNSNPLRKHALDTIIIKDSPQEIISQIHTTEGIFPKIVMTRAKQSSDSIDYKTMRNLINDGNPYLFLFGTAWGLAPQFLENSDYILEPIKGTGDYNHLSVRSAVSIILDRLLGNIY